MRLLRNIFITIASLLAFSTAAAADEKVQFEVNAPMTVRMGEGFRVEFALNAKPDDDSFVAPSFDGFDVVAGPATSKGESIQIINGKMSRSVNYTITYVLLPQSEGSATIGAAEIKVGGKSYSSQPTPIEVRGGESSQTSASSSSADNRRQSAEAVASNRIEKDDLLLRLHLSRNRVYKGEMLRATLKLYSRVSIAGSESMKMPSFNGFWKQDLDCEQGPFRETLDGKVYEAYTLAEYLLFPQQSGTLTIDPAELTIIARVIVQNNRHFDPFWGGGHEVYNVSRALTTPRISLVVDELPAGAPDSFGGAVGRYTMDAHTSVAEMSANSAAGVNVRISGAGNINFVQAPKIEFPTSFEQYDTKSTESIRNTASGSSGYKQFEYPFIARAEGRYSLPSVKFSYFNPDTKQYVTLEEPLSEIVVTPDKNSSSSAGIIASGLTKEDVRLLGNDIRHIHLAGATLQSRIIAPFFLTTSYFVTLAALLCLAVVVYIIVRKRRRDNGNIALVRSRRANKMAVRRFREAEKHLLSNNRRLFYEEMLRAMWGYMSDRFNIPVADLTKESIRSLLIRHGVTEENAQLATDIISECEEAQYSPIVDVRDDIYTRAIAIVSLIEQTIKR